MPSVLYVVVAPITLQDIPLAAGDLLAYNPSSHLARIFLDGNALNPPPVSLPTGTVGRLVAQALLQPTPATPT